MSDTNFVSFSMSHLQYSMIQCIASIDLFITVLIHVIVHVIGQSRAFLESVELSTSIRWRSIYIT